MVELLIWLMLVGFIFFSHLKSQRTMLKMNRTTTDAYKGIIDDLNEYINDFASQNVCNCRTEEESDNID